MSHSIGQANWKGQKLDSNQLEVKPIQMRASGTAVSRCPRDRVRGLSFHVSQQCLRRPVTHRRCFWITVGTLFLCMMLTFINMTFAPRGTHLKEIFVHKSISQIEKNKCRFQNKKQWFLGRQKPWVSTPCHWTSASGTRGRAARRSESTRLVPQRVSLSRETCVPWTWQIRVETPALL